MLPLNGLKWIKAKTSDLPNDYWLYGKCRKEDFGDKKIVHTDEGDFETKTLILATGAFGISDILFHLTIVH